MRNEYFNNKMDLCLIAVFEPMYFFDMYELLFFTCMAPMQFTFVPEIYCTC
jgi:hypothetical protein